MLVQSRPGSKVMRHDLSHVALPCPQVTHNTLAKDRNRVREQAVFIAMQTDLSGGVCAKHRSNLCLLLHRQVQPP